MPERRLKNPVLLICDLQEKFRPAIWEFPKVIATTHKMLKASEILSIPVLATTQNASKLGGTVAELPIERAGAVVDKTAFSMCVPDILARLPPGAPNECVIVGIESHICVTQTTLDLLAAGHKVYVLADGVSSCNAGEVGIALRRLASEGAVVTTSESFLYELMGDAGIADGHRIRFRQIAGLVRETKDSTKSTIETLCKM
ncbi:MAG: hypothetical protein M1832_000241 [Thelocarpon impressellum]|nr:MAG: hypothetical protein M1832_000241 [Thelocarpon impressellum]